MTDINYEVGLIKAQNESMKDDIDDVKTKLALMDTRLASIENSISTWKSSIGGAVFILVTLGNIALYFGEYVVNFIKVKLGL